MSKLLNFGTKSGGGSTSKKEFTSVRVVDIILDINDYKTEEKYGTKEIKITNEKFINEIKKMKLNDGDYLLSMKNGDKIKNISTFNDKILNLTIDKLGQNKLVKIMIKDLLNNKSYDKLEQLSRDRGTSLDILLKSYNLHNGEK